MILRGQKVILDTDLAELYGVSVGRFNEQVKRNQQRFPADFMFQLTAKEDQILRSQIAVSRKKHGGRRYLPYAFTEHGAIMAATVLNSKRAIEMSVFVVRAFVRMRELLARPSKNSWLQRERPGARSGSSFPQRKRSWRVRAALPGPAPARCPPTLRERHLC
jgi:hypothetical protein